jgi:integrase
MALRYAVEVDGILATNPASRVAIPKGAAKRNEPWGSQDLKLFLAEISKHRLFAFYRLAAYSGARRGEILALQWTDFDADRKRITISKNRTKALGKVIEQNSTKGGEGRRVVSLDDPTVEMLKAHRIRQVEERLIAGSAWNETGYIFAQETGEPIDPDTPTQLFARVSKRLGLPEQRLHDLRHIHATELLRAGVPLHAMVTATIYAHVKADQAESAANIFANAVE